MNLEKSVTANIADMRERASEITELLGLPRERLFTVLAAALQVKSTLMPIRQVEGEDRFLNTPDLE